jgi:hypothetical protein
MLRRMFVTFAVAVLVIPIAVWSADDNPSPVPMMRACSPDQGKAGEVVAVTGENLGKDRVAEVFLTKGSEDVKVELVSQTNAQVKFRVPAEAAAGRYALMVLTTTAIPQLIEQPVVFNVVR